MSIEELERMDTPVITPAVAASFLKCNPHWIRVAARQKPGLLGFPVSVVGNRTKIPRIPFIQFLKGQSA